MFQPSSLPLSHHAGDVETTAFHLQLRRLESLQTLMSQGASVVGEVAQFMIKVREELSSFECDRASLIVCQERLAEQKSAFEAKLEELENSFEISALKVAEQNEIIRQLEEKAVLAKAGPSGEAPNAEQLQREKEILSTAARVVELEATIERERRLHQQTAAHAIEEAAKIHAAEMSLMKSRLSSLNHQLALEKDRRSRLMQVVKEHEIAVVADRNKEMAS